MTKISTEQNDEHQKLINMKPTSYNNDDEHQHQTSRLKWAESSWTRCLYVWCWWWINPVLSKGYKGTLTLNDLDDLPHNDQSFVLLNRLKSHDYTSTSIMKIIVSEFWKEYAYVGLCCIPFMIVRIVQPLLVRQIVISTMNEEVPLLRFYILAISLALCVLIQAFLDHQISFRSMRIGARLRSALISLIYTRLLSAKSTLWQHMDTGQIISLVANDAYKFEEVCTRVYFLWEGPIETLVIFGCLCWLMQPIPALVGYITFLLSMVTLILIGRSFGKYREMTLSCNDKRIRAYNEFIHGAEIIKMYNWEKLIENRISEMRENELVCLKRAYYLRAVVASQSYCLVPLLAFTMIGTACLLKYPLNAADCFAAISFFSLLRGQVLFFTSLVTETLRDVQISSQRINSFIHLTMKHGQRSLLSASFTNQQQKGKITMLNASFSWSEGDPFLSSLNLTIEPGTLVGIVGPVGSGKSSLLAAILDEMNLVNGQLNTNNSSFSYTAQSPWIFADTLRNNILLNRTFDEQRYRNVIYACCLDVDLSLFGSSGDLTMIGEKGVNLSGGQKARVSLARALYADADIYLIDDPLAAVNRAVAEQIYERCLGPNGILKNKTRLLVTHHTQFLNEAHQIIFLSHGHIDEHGHLDQHSMNKDESEKKETSELANMLDENVPMPDTAPIVAKETSATVNVSWSLWFRLFIESPLGVCGFFLLILLLLSAEVFYNSANYSLGIWLIQPYTDQQHLPIYAYIYFGLLIATVLADIIRTHYYFFVILYGTSRLHNNMLKGLLRTSIQFFESNPSGRIIYRASTDQRIVEHSLPTILLYAIEAFLVSFGSIIIVCIIKPYILILFVAMVPILLLVYKYYSRSRLQLKQLESVTRSPIFEIFSSSLSGLIIIRVFKVQDHLIKLFTDTIDRNKRAHINKHGAQRWFALRLSLVPFFNTFIIIILMIVYRNKIEPSLIALCLTYAISIPKSFQMAIQQLFDASLLMVSAERIREYAQLPPEEDQGGQQRLISTSPKWPTHGKVEFRNYSLRHRSGLDSVLRNINLQIESGQKIGIIGRTGAGKSSLFKGIFRFIYRSNIDGDILIDDIDISRITLNHLRSHLSIIPQQPILFSGTLRYNLDPFNQYSDEECWMALEDVQLKQFVSKNSSGLLMTIGESGNNLSVGQCQLVCIARAILKKSKILLIDEATANVDKKTDEIIQAVFTNKFEDRTVLTIAHRLSTVAKCDRIVVLDKGIIVNFDTPMNILQHYQ